MSDNHLYADIETIPVQQDGAKAEIRQPFLDAALAECAGREQEIASLRPPGNIKDPAKIAAWEADERPKKVAALKSANEQAVASVEGKFEAAWRRTSFDGALCQVVAIAFAFGDEAPTVLHSGADWAKLSAEGKLLRAFFSRLSALPVERQATLKVVGHWVAEFDLRVLFQRAVIHGIPFPACLPVNAAPWSDKVYDTMAWWAGARGRISLDKLCRVLGIASKGVELGGDDIDGSKVWDFVREGRIADVGLYCGGDVERVREVHKRMTFGRV